MRLNFSIFLLILISSVAFAMETDMESWLDAPEKNTDEVSDGELSFPASTPQQPVHHLHNQIRITNESLDTGWVHLSQCHEHLDSVSAAQIVFHPERVRNLKVKDVYNIGKAWVEGPNIELEKIGESAKICIDAETRALTEANAGQFILRNGPFMRRFLDGYYPMRVSFTVMVPETELELLSVTPPPQPGFSLEQSHGKVRIDSLFEGKLNTVMEFTRL